MEFWCLICCLIENRVLATRDWRKMASYGVYGRSSLLVLEFFETPVTIPSASARHRKRIRKQDSK
jgi:hypothetical protein